MGTEDARSKWLLLVGTAVVAVAALLTWATLNAGFVSVSKAGTDGDGVITLLLALVVGGLLLAKWKAGLSRVVVIVSLVLGGIVLAIATYDAIDIASMDEETEFIDVQASIGIGLWLTLLGGIAMMAGAIWELRSPTPGATAHDATTSAAPLVRPSHPPAQSGLAPPPPPGGSTSDHSQGPGWWLAGDGKWYSPDLHPGRLASPTTALPRRPSDAPGPPPPPPPLNKPPSAPATPMGSPPPAAAATTAPAPQPPPPTVPPAPPPTLPVPSRGQAPATLHESSTIQTSSTARKRRKAGVLVAGVISLGALAFAVTRMDDDADRELSTGSSVESTTTTAEPTTTVPATTTTTARPGTRANPFMPGTPVTSASGVEVIAAVNVDADQAVAQAAASNPAPPAGQRYILVQLTIQNGTSEPIAPSAAVDVVASGSEKVLYSTSDCPAIASDSLVEAPAIPPGGTAAGSLCLLIPDSEIADGSLLIGLSLPQSDTAYLTP